MKHWIQAARLRTLPLAISTMIVGHSLASYDGSFSWPIALLSILTAVCLQVLSNFANDYGDTIHGADNDLRSGPSRAVQSGKISLDSMKKAMIWTGVVALILGISLVIIAFDDWVMRGIFIALGLSAIWAAVNYTAGNNPYGYSGKGDIAVFIFFGLVTVLGSYFLQTKQFRWEIMLPAISCGALSVGVLNINNIRDIASDRLAGKNSIPVKIGRGTAVIYHGLLLFVGLSMFVIFGLIEAFGFGYQWLFLLTIPLFLINFRAVVTKKDASSLDPFLKQLALSSALLFLLFSAGIFVFS